MSTHLSGNILENPAEKALREDNRAQREAAGYGEYHPKATETEKEDAAMRVAGTDPVVERAKRAEAVKLVAETPAPAPTPLPEAPKE